MGSIFLGDGNKYRRIGSRAVEILKKIAGCMHAIAIAAALIGTALIKAFEVYDLKF